MVLSPTVSSLREASKLQSKLKKLGTSAKVLFVLNYTIAEKFATVTQEEVVKYIGQPIDVIFPLETGLDAALLDKKRLHQSSSSMSQAVKLLTSLLLGEEGKVKSKGLLSRLGLRR
jgi:pilus assembly protein CpaE